MVNYTYRLAPEHKFPAQLEDTNSVITWIYDHEEEYRFDTKRIFLVGDSAGAHLTGIYTAICTDPGYAANFSFKVPHNFVPTKILMNCGAYQPFTKAGQAIEDIERNDELMGDLLPDKDDPKQQKLVDVIAHVNANFPPAFIMTAKGDFLIHQAPVLAETYRKLGIDYCYKVYGDEEHPLYHVFHLNIKEPMAKICNDEEGDFLLK